MEKRLWNAVEARNYWNREPEASILREVTKKALPLTGGFEALYFFGPRRAGKTTVCLQLLSALSRRSGKRSCLYINFEEPAFGGRLDAELLEEIFEEFARRFGCEPVYVFLDEVQGVMGWEKWVRSAVDRKRCHVFVTGSSSKLLSSEFASTLSGRGIGFKVMPFSWREYRSAVPRATFDGYLSTGGYPAVVLEKNKEKQMRLLEEYFESAIARDIAGRHDVRDVQGLKSLAVFVLTNPGGLVSLHKLRPATGLSYDSLRQYLSYLEEAFLVFAVPHFSYSLKQAMAEPRKYYACDTGLQLAVSKSFSPDRGKSYENAVAISLFRENKDTYYYRGDSADIDFVVKEGARITAMNVCSSPDAPARERRSLDVFTAAHPHSPGILLAGESSVSAWLAKG